MANIAASLLKLFKRKKTPPLACHLSLDQDDSHVHTAACFLEVEPLALAELFQAQGCSACPAALPGIHEATAHPNLHLITYDVTYFNNLYNDPYASPRWDQRQKNYVRKWGRNSLFTPMVVVNGVADGGSNGGTVAEIGSVVRKAREIAQQTMDWHIYLDASDSLLRIDTDKLEIETHDVLLIVFENKEETIKIGKGPNKGKKIKQKNLVKDVIKVGGWSGGNTIIEIPVLREHMEPGTGAIAVVQAPMGGPVVAVCNIV